LGQNANNTTKRKRGSEHRGGLHSKKPAMTSNARPCGSILLSQGARGRLKVEDKEMSQPENYTTRKPEGKYAVGSGYTVGKKRNYRRKEKGRVGGTKRTEKG